ncbi:RNA methyltransferase, partial [Nocardia neocaledoniensis]|uniref:RNA methyltransferase n=1 Tax=Nocardia neocaledoniensis TaxID=236511 RepID=UPI002458BAD3
MNESVSTPEVEVAGPTEWGEHPHGLGPWEQEYGTPAPTDPRYDPVLLLEGDRRNVVDAYRYWTREAIVADIDARRFPFHVAIENFGHDANIGTVVRTANAFAAAAVHIVGRRRGNRRGAMVTARDQHRMHHGAHAAQRADAPPPGRTIVA